MSPLHLALAGVVACAGAIVQGSIGFGLNVVSAPLLVLIDTRFVPGPTLVAAFVLATLVGVRERGGIDRRGVGWIVAGRVPGTFLGALAIGKLSGAGVAIALSSIVLVDVGLSSLGWKVPRTTPVLSGIGVLSGVMGTVTSIGGPPVAMLYKDSEGQELRGTLSVIFSVGALMSIVVLAVSGHFGAQEIKTSLVLAPGVTVGFVASHWTKRFVDRGRVRPFVLGFCALAALAALLKYAL